MGLLDRLQSMFQSNRVDIRERFEILRKAVSGTMSKFYKARDLKTGRIVGLKIAEAEKVAAFEARFKGLSKPCEGAIAMDLNGHPLVVETYEYGQTTEGIPFIVMEFVNGPGLQSLLLNHDPVVGGMQHQLVRQMAEALEYVHAKQYIHRDVCPRNFIYESHSGNLRLIDFGLTLPARRAFMQPGNRTGTPLYMAPEVVRRRWTDQRLDIFAMGVSAYQICTFELPWPVIETSGKAALAHDTHEPREILEYAPDLDPVMARSIMRCLRPNPNDRPQTVSQFLMMLRGHGDAS